MSEPKNEAIGIDVSDIFGDGVVAIPDEDPNASTEMLSDEDSIWHPGESNVDDANIWHADDPIPVIEPEEPKEESPVEEKRKEPLEDVEKIGDKVAEAVPETPAQKEEPPVTGGRFLIDPRMYLYFDMEFTSLTRDADLISIGLCDAEGHSFYAEFNDFDYNKVNSWVFENVCKRMVRPKTNLLGDHWEMIGNTKDIAKNLLIWLNDIHNHTGCGIQFVTDCGHYDMVFLIDLLWGTATNMPEWISPVAVDINLDLSNLVSEMYLNKPTGEEESQAFNPYHHAFNLSRDEYASHIANAPKGLQHNSMYDAYVIRAIHQSIWDIQVEPTPLTTENA